MNIKKGIKKIKKNTKTSIMDIDFPKDYTIHVFQGDLSPNDILIKYKSPFSSSIRTPKHIHWAVDLLIKFYHNKRLTPSFVNDIKKMWIKVKPLKNNNFKTLESFINDCFKNIDINKYVFLNTAGEYLVEFLFTLMCLLAVQEKTNASAHEKTAHMFGDVLDEFQKPNLDIFRIMSTASFGGR